MSSCQKSCERRFTKTFYPLLVKGKKVKVIFWCPVWNTALSDTCFYFEKLISMFSSSCLLDPVNENVLNFLFSLLNFKMKIDNHFFPPFLNILFWMENSVTKTYMYLQSYLFHRDVKMCHRINWYKCLTVPLGSNEKNESWCSFWTAEGVIYVWFHLSDVVCQSGGQNQRHGSCSKWFWKRGWTDWENWELIKWICFNQNFSKSLFC